VPVLANVYRLVTALAGHIFNHSRIRDRFAAGASSFTGSITMTGCGAAIAGCASAALLAYSPHQSLSITIGKPPAVFGGIRWHTPMRLSLSLSRQ